MRQHPDGMRSSGDWAEWLMDVAPTRIAADAKAPLAHRFRSTAGEHVLVVPFSRIFDLPPEAATVFDSDGSGLLAMLAASVGET